MKSIVLTLALLVSSAAAAADHPLTGTWKLEFVESENVATGERQKTWGEHPEGLMTIAADGRSFTIMVPPDPKMPLNANASTHRLTGEAQTTIHRELAAAPGPDQIRNFKIEGNKLTMSTLPVKGADGKETRSLLHWIRLR